MIGLEPADLTGSLPARLHAGLTALNRGNQAQARELADKALRDLNAADSQAQFTAHYLMLRTRPGQPEESDLRHGLQLLTLAETLNRNDYRSLAHSEIGEIYRLLGMHEKARRHLRESLRHADSTDTARMALPFLRLGLSQLDVGEPREALVLLERARTLFRLLNESALTTQALLAEARAFIALGNPDTAMQRLEAAESLILKTEDRKGLTGVQREYARVHALRGDQDAARECLRLALDLHAEGVDRRQLGRTRLQLAELHLARNELAATLANLRSALHEFRQDTNPEGNAKVLRLMATVHERAGEHEAALGALKEHLLLRQQIQRQAGEQAALARILQLEQSLAHEHSSALRSRKALVSANRKLREQSVRLEELSRTDHLTGLFNRRHLTELLERELADDQRARPLALILLDIDAFKAVNDVHGHGLGDQVLSQLATLLRSGAGPEAAAGHWGGEEFAVIVPGADLQQGAQVAEMLRELISRHDWTSLAAGLAVSVSAGVAATDPAGRGTLANLIRVADNRLYLAKQDGRNRVVASG